MSKIFITGITGFLGRHVARKCAVEGHQVIALVRNKKITISNFDFSVEICHGDLTAVSSYKNELEQAEVIIHCAADTRMFAFKNKQQEAINVQAVKDMIGIAKRTNLQRFIFLSSANTIIPGTHTNPSIEMNRNSENSKNLPYINTKIQAENLLIQEYQNDKFPSVIFNPTFMLGPDDYSLSSGKLIMTMMKNKNFLLPEGGKNVVDIRDVADVVYNAISKGKLGEHYLLSNEIMSYSEMFEEIHGSYNNSFTKNKLLKPIGKGIGYLGSLFELLTNKTFSINHKIMRLAYENHYYDSTKAKQDLGFNPRPLDETINDTITWYTNEYFPNKKSKQF